MSNARAHALAALPAGVALAAYQARDQAPQHKLAEIVGGALGAYLGGRAPDILEPATSPNHRAFFHSVTFVTAAGTLVWHTLTDCQEWCRQMADEANARAGAASDDLSRAFHRLVEFAFRFLAGALAGLVGGYGSHLVLDSTTRAGLPFLTQGC